MMVRGILTLLAVGFLVGCRSDSGADADAIAVDRLRVPLPDSWQQVPPSSGMRLAQFSIPGSAGAAEMAVFHFGPGQGGDVEQNITRWIGQIETTTPPQRAVIDEGGLRITIVDATGTLKAGQMGMGPATAQPGSRLLGAVIEGDGGPWFFKATGPDATLGPQRDAFIEMLQNTTLAPG